MLSPDLLYRVTQQLDAARSMVAELERIRDEIVQAEVNDGNGRLFDNIAGIGPMRRSRAYKAALKLGTKRSQPSYEDDNGELWTLFTGSDYIRFANKFGIGRMGNGLVLLNITEHAKVRRAIRQERQNVR